MTRNWQPQNDLVDFTECMNTEEYLDYRAEFKDAHGATLESFEFEAPESFNSMQVADRANAIADDRNYPADLTMIVTHKETPR